MAGQIASVVRAGGAAVTLVGVALSALVVVNAAELGATTVHRLREPTLLVWFGLITVLLARADRATVWERWCSAVEGWLGSRRGRLTVLTVGGVLIVSSSVTHHLAFNTYSHDLGLYQQALANAWGSPPLYSTTLGGSFLGEHFSPVLFVIAPLYRLLPSPLTLVVLNGVFLWLGALPLLAVGRALGLKPAVVTLIAGVYLFFPTTARAAGYPFHHETLYPAVLIGLYLALLHRRTMLSLLLVLAAIAIKEDAGLYLVGLGLFAGLHHNRWRWGSAVAVSGAVATTIAVFWLIPHFSAAGAGYGFHGRWIAWLDPVGFPNAVASLARALLTEDVITVFAATLLLPFSGRWTWVVVAVPFALNLTSANPNQAQLSLYYGAPVAATAAIAAVAALAARPPARRRGRVLAAAALVINVAALTYPPVPTCRGEVLAALRNIDPEAQVAMAASIDPLLQHVPDRVVIRGEAVPDADVVILRTDRYTWPLDRRRAADLDVVLSRRPDMVEILRCAGFVIYRRAEGP